MKSPSYTLTAALAAILLPSTAEAALVSYLALDNATGLTLNNGAAITSGGQGKFGEALALDGVNQWASAGTNPLSGSGNRTISTWVYMNAGSGTHTAVAFGTNSLGAKWDFDIDNANGGIEVGVNGGRRDGTGLTNLTGRWMLMVSTLSGGTTLANVSTYLDGGITATTTGSPAREINTAATNYFLGVSANGAASMAPQFFDGRIDDVAIWNVALTAAEIRGLYDVGMSVDLSYTADKFDLLRQRHNLATGSTTIGGLEWIYTTGLSGPAGLTTGPGGYTLVLDATNGTGLTAIPEPAAALLGGLGLLALLRRRNR